MTLICVEKIPLTLHCAEGIFLLLLSVASSTYSYGVRRVSATGPIRPEGRSGESTVKNLKQPTVFIVTDAISLTSPSERIRRSPDVPGKISSGMLIVLR